MKGRIGGGKVFSNDSGQGRERATGLRSRDHLTINLAAAKRFGGGGEACIGRDSLLRRCQGVACKERAKGERARGPELKEGMMQ